MMNSCGDDNQLVRITVIPQYLNLPLSIDALRSIETTL